MNLRTGLQQSDDVFGMLYSKQHRVIQMDWTGLITSHAMVFDCMRHSVAPGKLV